MLTPNQRYYNNIVFQSAAYIASAVPAALERTSGCTDARTPRSFGGAPVGRPCTRIQVNAPWWHCHVRSTVNDLATQVSKHLSPESLPVARWIHRLSEVNIFFDIHPSSIHLSTHPLAKNHPLITIYEHWVFISLSQKLFYKKTCMMSGGRGPGGIASRRQF